MYKVFGKDGWEDVHLKDFGAQKKALLGGKDSTLATPYVPNLVEFFLLLILLPNLSKCDIIHPVRADHSVRASGRRSRGHLQMGN